MFDETLRTVSVKAFPYPQTVLLPFSYLSVDEFPAWSFPVDDNTFCLTIAEKRITSGSTKLDTKMIVSAQLLLVQQILAAQAKYLKDTLLPKHFKEIEGALGGLNHSQEIAKLPEIKNLYFGPTHLAKTLLKRANKSI